MIPPHEAFSIVLEYVRPLGRIRLPLDRVFGYCLAENVRADRDIPPADRSAMDGYAIRSSDLTELPCSLRLVGEVAAGSASRPRVKPGTCVRILTGANVPPGADTVVMVEYTQEHNNIVTFRAPTKPGSNILRKGEDAKKRETLLSKGTILRAAQIGVCAAVGKSEIRVYRRPRIVVLCTGEELRGIRDRVRSYEMRNSSGPAVCAALEMWGYPGAKHSVVPDDVRRLTSKLKRAVARHDAVLLTGGVSVGKYDFAREAVENIGATIRYHRVGMKPGKPSLYATLSGNRHIFGLPGNPLSSMTGFHEFALPALHRLSGFPVETCRPSLHVPLANPIVSKENRVRFVLTRLLWSKEGPLAETLESHSSADFVAGGRADGVVIVPVGTQDIAAGSLMEFRPWRPLP